MSNHKIVVTIVDGLHFRYLVDTTFLFRLSQRGYHLHLFVIPSLVKRVEEEAASFPTPVVIHFLPDVQLNFRQRLYMGLINQSNFKITSTLNIKNELQRKNSFRNRLLSFGTRRLPLVFRNQRLLSLLSNSFVNQELEKAVGEIEPAVVITSTPGQKIQDLPMLKACQTLGYKTLSPVYSWDNLTSKGPFYFPVGNLAVWNNIMKEEALFFHGYDSEHVFVTGVPVFDPYVTVLNESAEERQNFFKQIGFPEERPLITITTIPQIFFGKSHILLALKIQQWMDIGSIPTCSILIRPHPKDTTDYSQLQKHPLIRIDNYGSQPDDSLKHWVPQKDNMIHLGRTMRYSSIVVNIASTITIDAACFDTPVINLNYDFKNRDSDYMGSIKRYYHYSHYVNVVKIGAAALVSSDQELTLWINRYLASPQVHREERAQLVEQQNGKLDGRASERLADVIDTILK